MSQSKIEWTELTWNPTTGCTKISSGCKNCYAEKMAMRLKAMRQNKYRNGFKLTLHKEVLNEPYLWKKSKIVFVNSMSDLFHEDIPFDFIAETFKVMNNNPQHIFQVLTKRAEILKEYSEKLCWTDNIWMGVTVENQENVYRIASLKQTSAHVKFLSIEPLIGEIKEIDLHGIDWVIVGGESGAGARPMNKDWVISIKNKCIQHDVPFFFKQWGGIQKKKNGRLLENREWSQMPEVKILVPAQ